MVSNTLLASILACVDEQLVNGIVDGFNDQLRTVSRRAFCFHSERPASTMLLPCCGDILLFPPLPTH